MDGWMDGVSRGSQEDSTLLLEFFNWLKKKSPSLIITMTTMMIMITMTTMMIMITMTTMMIMITMMMMMRRKRRRRRKKMVILTINKNDTQIMSSRKKQVKPSEKLSKYRSTSVHHGSLANGKQPPVTLPIGARGNRKK